MKSKTQPETLEYEVFEYRFVEESVEAVEIEGGRTLRSPAKNCQIIKRGPGQRYDRLRVQRGKYAIL